MLCATTVDASLAERSECWAAAALGLASWPPGEGARLDAGGGGGGGGGSPEARSESVSPSPLLPPASPPPPRQQPPDDGAPSLDELSARMMTASVKVRETEEEGKRERGRSARANAAPPTQQPAPLLLPSTQHRLCRSAPCATVAAASSAPPPSRRRRHRRRGRRHRRSPPPLHLWRVVGVGQGDGAAPSGQGRQGAAIPVEMFWCEVWVKEKKTHPATHGNKKSPSFNSHHPQPHTDTISPLSLSQINQPQRHRRRLGGRPLPGRRRRHARAAPPARRAGCCLCGGACGLPSAAPATAAAGAGTGEWWHLMVMVGGESVCV